MSADDDREHLRMIFGMFAFNGLLTRLNPNEIDIGDVWEFVDAAIQEGENKPSGIMAIKPKRKNTRRE